MLAQRGRVGADGEAEEQQRRRAEEVHGQELGAAAPLQSGPPCEAPPGAPSRRPPRRRGRGAPGRQLGGGPGPRDRRPASSTTPRSARPAPRSSRWVATRTVTPRSPKRADQAVHEPEPGRVELPVGLVEHHDGRVPEQRPRQREALAHPGRERGHGVVGPVREVHGGEAREQRLASGRLAHEARRDPQVLQGRQGLVVVRVVGEQRHALPHARRARASRRSRPPGRCRGPDGSPSRGCGAGSTFPEPLRPVTITTWPAGHLEAHVHEGPAAAVATAEAGGVDRQGGCAHPGEAIRCRGRRSNRRNRPAPRRPVLESARSRGRFDSRGGPA